MLWTLPEQCGFLSPNLVRKQLCIWSMKIWYSIEVTNRCLTMNISCYLIILLTSHSWQYSAFWSSRCLREIDITCYIVLKISSWRSENNLKTMVSHETVSLRFWRYQPKTWGLSLAKFYPDTEKIWVNWRVSQLI